MKRTRLTAPLMFGLLPWLAACSLTPSYQMPDAKLPSYWETVKEGTAQVADTRWWLSYHSDELDQLMQQALAANHDLAAAVSRIEQARASLRSARSVLLPSAGLSASASHDRRRADDVTTTSEDSQAGVSIAYELDLWGANRAAAAAADATLAASRYSRDSVALVLQAEVASTYFQLLSLRDRLVIAQRNLDAAQELMRLVQVRFDNGAATALDVAQQRTTLLGIQAQIPSLQQSVNETRHALAVLLGQVPQGFDVVGASLAELNLPTIDPGQPSALLLRRPDIRMAEAQLMAANADIGAARAALLPSLDLSASATATGLISGGSATVASLAASLAQTIFSGGRLRAQVALTEATRQTLAETYAQTVLTGLQEVEDSLSLLDTSLERTDLLAQTAEQAREAYRLARVRYDAGAIDLLTLLDSQRTQLSAEDTLVQAQLTQINATAQLVKALGGGWSDAVSG
ncbi:efflux transporter outer membrane subunit [Sinimarinibacterium sp. CAU 1509]|uniref:efflux transporter outer membrane subunit n=1 Tax=Sinimarinibacterium sp. CAU 1509 TaxID=2562283 RepID=UPI00146A29B1|nr:efflux transporter outer membrane subunit [Sinimarinibacterium sp. CAU 1509]